MKKIRILKTIALTLTIASFIAISPSKASAEGQAYWKSNNNNWYYIDSTGKTQTGWLQDNGHWYYLGSDGVMKTGWLYDGGNWYYLWSNGQMATDTTIGGYYLNSSGAWTTSTITNSGTALIPQDVSGNHHVRGDIALGKNDSDVANQLTNYNLTLSDDSNLYLRSLALNLAQGRIFIDEARNNCIGKVVDGKYKITDIKFFDQSFTKATTGTETTQKIKAIQNSNLYSYNSSSSYKYDRYLSFTCGNARAAEWEAMRVVVELEVV